MRDTNKQGRGRAYCATPNAIQEVKVARKGDAQRLDDIRDAIIKNPGRRPGWLARRMGFDNKTMMRALAQLEARGDLLTEDEKGRLSWFGRTRSS